MKFANADRRRRPRVGATLECLEGRLLLAFGLGPGPMIDANTYSAADVDGDGKPDLAGVGGGEIGFRLNLGDAAFAPLVSVDSGLAKLSSVQFADVTGDGKPDAIAVDGTDGQLAILPGLGGGAFGAATVYDDPGIGSVIPVDVNGDGKVDLVAGFDGFSPRADLFRNRGDGTFDLHSGVVSFAPQTYADFDGDGKVDLAGIIEEDTGDQIVAELAVARGNGDGTFAAPTLSPIPGGTLLYTPIDARQVVGPGLTTMPVDFNGDGKPDLVSSGYEAGINVLLNDGKGGFLPAIHDDVPGGASFFRIADLDGDGKPDLAFIQGGSGTFSFAMNGGGGHFGKALPLPFLGPNAATRQAGDFDAPGLDAADFDGDGRPDLLGVGINFESGVAASSLLLSGFHTPPVLTSLIDRTGDLNLNTPVRFQASAFDDDGRATIRYAANVGTIDPVTGDFSYLPTAPGTVVVRITATASLGKASLSTSRAFRITTHAPTPPAVPLLQSSLFPTDAGAAWTTKGTYLAGANGLASATVDYGDGTGTMPLVLTPPTFTLAHTYAAPGTYTVRVTLTDRFGGVGTATATETVLSSGGSGGGTTGSTGTLPPVQVSSITETVTKGAITAFNVAFTGPVAGMTNPGSYHLLLVTTKRVKKKLVTTTKRLHIKWVRVDSSGTIAHVAPAGRLLPSKINELTITATGLTDAQGRSLDGDRDGQPGGDLIAAVRGKIVTIR